MIRYILLITIFPFFCLSQNNTYNNFSDELFLMFYNVENLFDTIDSPNNIDNEFFPSSGKKWNSHKYYHKLEQLDKVFLSLVYLLSFYTSCLASYLNMTATRC